MLVTPIDVLPIGSPHVLTIAGDFTSTTVHAALGPLERAVTEVEREARESNTLRIELPVARIIDSVGLNVLIGAIKRVRAARGVIVLRVGTASARRILTFARLDRVVQLEGGA